MILTERHIIKKAHVYYDECDGLCFASKNLYNQGLFNVRKYYFDNAKYLGYVSNFHVTKVQESYKGLPAKVSNQTLKGVDRNFKSFFALLKNKKVKNKIPSYLNKVTGRYVATYEKQALSKMEFKRTGRLKLSGSNIIIDTTVKELCDIKEVRIVPSDGFYVLDVVYQKIEKITDSRTIAALDPGLNNLAADTYNDTQQTAFVINGRPAKSINCYYNKRKAELQGKLKGNRKTSDAIKKLTNKRNNKIIDYLHKSSRLLVNQLVEAGVGTLVIGKNTNQKQDINIGKVGNQNFTPLPLFKFLDTVAYKCKLEGIEVFFHEESYTSKCSFLDSEPVRKHETYAGSRIKRGLFRSYNGSFINADLNGSYNIMKKVFPNAFVDGIQG
jgi:putative transposase